jgi:aminoglycoside phosphotransferase (APT) family kinase protein
MQLEARTMTYMREQGYPVPAVEEVSDDGVDLVMERIKGRSMVDALAREPWRVHRHASTLADLHLALHRIRPPDFLPPAPVGTGGSVLHMDLHPLNVMVGPAGPVVIDWTNASIGDPNADVGVAWVLMAAGQIPGPRVVVTLLGRFRALLVNGFVSHFDRAEVAARLRQVVEWKAGDQNMSEAEVAAMWKVVSKAEAGL